MQKATTYRRFWAWFLQQKRRERIGPPSEGLLLYAKNTTDTIGLSSVLKSRAAVDVPTYSAPEITGTTYYVDTNATFNGDGSASTQALGAGQVGAFNSIDDAYAASATGDAILFLPGVHYDVQRDFAKGIFISSVSGNPSDTIIDFNDGLYYWQVRNHTGAIIFDSLTFRNSAHTAAGAMQINSTETNPTIIQRCVIKDNVFSVRVISGSSINIIGNKFLGTTENSKHISIVLSKTINYDININNNIFGVSENYFGGGLFVSSSVDTTQTINFNNNVVMGSGNYTPVYLVKTGTVAPSVIGSNNILFGGRHNSSIQFSAAIAGDAENCVLQNTMVIGPNNSVSALDDGTLGATITGTINAEPGFIKYPRYGAVALGIDDNSAYLEDEQSTGELIPILAKHGVHMTWFCSAGSIIEAQKIAIKDWLDAGNEIGLHGFSHTGLRATTALDGVTKTGEALTITIDDSDSDITNWTGTITIDGGNSVTVDGDIFDETNISNLSELITWLESEGITVEGTTLTVSSGSLIVNLADQVSLSIDSSTDLPLDKTRFLETEVTYAKSLLESIVRTISGYTSWNCVSYAAPYNDADADGMDALKDVGLTSGRTDDNPDVPWLNSYGCNLTYPLNIYGMAPLQFTENDWFGSMIDPVTHTVTPAQVYGSLTWLAIQGAVASFYMHKETGPVSYTDDFLTTAQEMVDRGNIFIGCQSEVAEYVRDNGTIISGDGSGSQEQWYFTFEDDSGDYRLLPDSPAISAGIDPFTDGDGDQYDAAGYKVWDDTYDTPDGQAMYGWSIGAYQYNHSSPFAYHLEVVSGTSWADWVVKPFKFPALIAADDGTLFTATVPNEIDATDRAGMTGDQFFFSTVRGLGVYDADLTGTDLEKADRYWDF